MTNKFSKAPLARTAAGDGDLTAKARIRNAALELHATKGEANTTVREVAQAAGVTHGLVVHHFVNKEGLRRAVHGHVVDLWRQALNDVSTDRTPAEVGRARDASVARMHSEHPAVLRYLRRVLLDSSTAGDELLEVLAKFTLAQIRELRAAGIATSTAPEHKQVFAIIMRELAPRLLAPVAEQLWGHLAGRSGGPPPDLDVRIKAPK
jgi:AcrR family transcriptional regulator